MTAGGDEESKSVMGIPLIAFVVLVLLLVFFAMLTLIIRSMLSKLKVGP